MELAVEIPYDRVGAVKRLINPPVIELIDESYGESVRLNLRVRASGRKKLVDSLRSLSVHVSTEMK